MAVAQQELEAATVAIMKAAKGDPAIMMHSRDRTPYEALTAWGKQFWSDGSMPSLVRLGTCQTHWAHLAACAPAGSTIPDALMEFMRCNGGHHLVVAAFVDRSHGPSGVDAGAFAAWRMGVVCGALSLGAMRRKQSELLFWRLLGSVGVVHDGCPVID